MRADERLGSGGKEHSRNVQNNIEKTHNNNNIRSNMSNGNQNSDNNNSNSCGAAASVSAPKMAPAAANKQSRVEEERRQKQRQRPDRESVMQRTLSKLNKRRRRLRRKFNKGLSRYTKSLDAELAHTERQNSVQTSELFKYAQVRERLAICLGVLFMFYAASWQPISVFILATMASLMGQYAKQTSWLNQMLVVGDESSGGSLAVSNLSSSLSGPSSVDIESVDSANASSMMMMMTAAAAPPPQAPSLTSRHSSSSSSLWSSPGVQVTLERPAALGVYSDQLPLLAPFHSFVGPIFDLGASSLGVAPLRPATLTESLQDASSASSGDEVKLAVEEILSHESHQFLRRSFEINGSAFLLGLSQLSAFFLGMSLITYVARRQASRLKILYFKSCLHQEVTWYESIDSASGSGSSLNALVDKYEDGIGPKLALLCYFLGHVILFACTAFYQMLSLASFCTCFVITVGLLIIYLGGGQAVAIGEHALFAKRSLQLAEEILASIRTVFAFNGQQKELNRYQASLEPVYRKSLIKHFYTALNTSLSKFSIFACFSAYCFYARHLFPPYNDGFGLNKATVLAVMRGGEVSIVNILISIPFMEALQQSKGSIARIYAAIERRSQINPSSERGARPNNWTPSISFRMVQFGYADRAGPTQRHRSTLPQLGGRTTKGSDLAVSSAATAAAAAALATTMAKAPSGHEESSGKHLRQQQQQSADRRRRSIIDELVDELADDVDQPEPPVQFISNSENLKPALNENGAPSKTLSAATSGHNQHHQTIGGGGASEPQRKNSGLDRGATRINNNNSSRCDGGGLANPASGGVSTQPLAAAAAAAAAAPTLMPAIDVDRVHQRQQDKRVLNKFNLEIKAGQSVALVGPSGSGKSTVLSLILRLYDITGGQLLIGQHNIKDLNVQWLRNQIGVVTQEPRLFDMSIADNIRLGLPAASHRQQRRECHHQEQRQKKSNPIGDGYSDELMNENDDSSGSVPANMAAMDMDDSDHHVMQQVIEASKAAGAHDFIMKLPQGYSTRVGSGGVQLSGGQKQRIAIARALIRRPSILLLDESTSALDTESETQVLRALKEASATRTTITVAHRLKTIKHVDLIVVMSQGQVIECGTHDELMASEHSTYKKMYQDQIEASERQEQCRAGMREAPLKGGKTDCKGGLLDQIEFITPGVDGGGGVDDDGDAINCTIEGADKTSRDEKKLEEDHLDVEYDDNEDSEGSSSDNSDYGDDELDGDDSDDDDNDDGDQSTSDKSHTASKPNFWILWQFVEPPKWTSVATIVVCLLAGLVLPMNLIAHSYLFSAFAYNELEQIGEYLYFFGLVLLSFSTFVFIVTFLQVILPGYLGEKISIRLRVKTMDSFLHKPMFYFDMDANSAGSLCDRLNSYVSNIQNIAGTRIATILEAVSTLLAGAIFGFGQNLTLSMFCLSFALLVLVTTVIESRIVQRESSIHQRYDAQLAHLMADTLSNIKTIASLNKETFFIDKFSEIIKLRERG